MAIAVIVRLEQYVGEVATERSLLGEPVRSPFIPMEQKYVSFDRKTMCVHSSWGQVGVRGRVGPFACGLTPLVLLPDEPKGQSGSALGSHLSLASTEPWDPSYASFSLSLLHLLQIREFFFISQVNSSMFLLDVIILCLSLGFCPLVAIFLLSAVCIPFFHWTFI